MTDAARVMRSPEFLFVDFTDGVTVRVVAGGRPRSYTRRTAAEAFKHARLALTFYRRRG